MGRDKKFSEEDLWRVTQELILDVGYDGFTMSLLSAKIGVSRAAIYKHYPNKEELIIQFMLEKMEDSVTILTGVDHTLSFEAQLEELIKRIFSMKELHQILGHVSKVDSVTPIVASKKEQLLGMHHGLYEPLKRLILQGKKEALIAQDTNDFLLLSFIFQTIEMPNHTGMENELFMQEIKKLLMYGITK
ncbi:TetR/AcrR family transcriptional regulator [Kurthia sibirica]|uniref:TetR/AcrR family transcriptional regulator n=1 Tax=Kurthia sibirica TaxID=202750 RepID=A0A2U3AGQ6_9BACL|nr:TetR/AcrR family transcriptional regulator [Kurthia sibirica]PWI23705.1 TetR/AcrR family transcriptional regulator [Kurthia sibirica]GEK35240.1 hypothetical protein KSI01_27730 [Kurthia sibirica]